MQRALRREDDARVPCAGCTACCTASQFIVIEPDETATLAHVAPDVVFPAPRLPRGYMVLAHDTRGRCAMLVDGACSIYEHRPRACRTYDCRVLAATDTTLDEVPKSELMARVERWRFRHDSERARARHDAVLAAARYLRDHRDELREAGVPAQDTQLAVLAVEIHDVFLGDTGVVEVDLDSVATAVRTAIEASARLSHAGPDRA
jgi:Fe-S-cluster containining protein